MSLAFVLFCVFVMAAAIGWRVGQAFGAPSKDEHSMWAELDKLVEKKTSYQAVMLDLQKADLKLRYSEYMGFHAAAAITLGAVAFALGGPPWGVVGALGGLAMPRLYVLYRHGQRVRKLNSQLVEVLVLVSNALKSGHSFLQGITLVVDEGPRPIADEFDRAVKDIKLGSSVEKALDALVERTTSEDLDLVATAVKIQRQIGGNLAEILDNVVHTIRERVRIKGEINTLTAQGRMQGWILGLLPVVVVLVVLSMSPEFMAPLFTTTLGKVLLVVAASMQALGIVMIKRIADIKV